MTHNISLSDLSNKSLAQSILPAIEMLALFYAELARVLHFKNDDLKCIPLLLIIDDDKLNNEY